MTIHSAIEARVRRLCEKRELPDIARLYPPSENIPHRRDKKFGVIALTDGSCGFFSQVSGVPNLSYNSSIPKSN